jgi:putative alpha-1,2-mannosidase
LEYKKYWKKDFADLTKDDIDKMPARGMYQGTVWQYRWFVPFDIKGLKDVMGGEKNYISQLDQFLLRIITIMLTNLICKCQECTMQVRNLGNLKTVS